MNKAFLATCVFATLAMPALADDFINGGFEAGTALTATNSAWTLNSGDWYSNGSQTLNGTHQGDSTLIHNTTASLTTGPTDANTGGHLQEIFNGFYSARLNNAANGAHFSTLTQSVSNYTGSDLYFAFAAVLENPSNPHTEAQTPKFSFSIFDVTKSLTLYYVAFDSRNASSQGVTWNTGVTTNNDSTWMYSDWNLVHINASAITGDTVTVTVMAYDCALGGHGGYAYVDTFQQTEPTANPGVTVKTIEAKDLKNIPEPSTMGLWFVGGALLLGGRKLRALKNAARLS